MHPEGRVQPVREGGAEEDGHREVAALGAQQEHHGGGCDEVCDGALHDDEDVAPAPCVAPGEQSHDGLCSEVHGGQLAHDSCCDDDGGPCEP